MTDNKKPDYDVLIIGAGISGISAAVHLLRGKANTSFAVLEARESFGGTWDLFKYPGIRSDSDMYTFGFSFKPWLKGNPLAEAHEIIEYLQETIDEYHLADKIQFGCKIKAANWSSQDQMWALTVVDIAANLEKTITCRFLHSCMGYYNYEHGHMPDFDGTDTYKGTLVHAQQWDKDTDYKDKSVVVIGSGATAVTLIPAMAKDTKHITMLQRSPTYMMSRPAIDKWAVRINKFLPKMLAYRINRTKNILMGMFFYTLCRRKPKQLGGFMVGEVHKAVGDSVDVKKHFTPTYDPWDQRVCVVPDNDLFNAIKDGGASIETDTIDHFTEDGILLKSGKELQADIVISATGLEIQFLGGMKMTLDGKAVNPSELVNYRGMMFSNIPNMIATFGYTNASWTLKADLTAGYMTRLIAHMNKNNYTVVMPKLDDPSIAIGPIADLQSGYLLRAADQLPKQGADVPWRNKHNYTSDLLTIKYASYDDGALIFSKS